MPILEVELADYLKVQGYGNISTDTWRPVIFWAEQPEREEDGHRDNVITVVQDPDGPPLRELGQQLAFSILVRNKDYIAGRELAEQIYLDLHEKQAILSTIKVAWLRADFSPIHLGRDSNRLHEFTQSFTIFAKLGITPVTTGQ